MRYLLTTAIAALGLLTSLAPGQAQQAAELQKFGEVLCASEGMTGALQEPCIYGFVVTRRPQDPVAAFDGYCNLSRMNDHEFDTCIGPALTGYILRDELDELLVTEAPPPRSGSAHSRPSGPTAKQFLYGLGQVLQDLDRQTRPQPMPGWQQRELGDDRRAMENRRWEWNNQFRW